MISCQYWQSPQNPSPILRAPPPRGSRVRSAADRGILSFQTLCVLLQSNVSGKDLEAYLHWQQTTLTPPPQPDHRLSGYPQLLQASPLEAQAQGKHETGDPIAHSQDIAASLKWQLLLQLDSDDHYMWGTDSGMLYLMIHEDDLKAGDFSRVMAMTQGC